ncbi:universal stress protein [Streptomyces sp.]|uniref:universal stress protein n=1 Tax=Streptomyces sp. TaxID=1931 RepID=UPI002F950739
MSTGDETRRVVVGVDGSPASYEALRWAVRHARQIGATVDVVATYDVPGAVGRSAPPVAAAFDEEEARLALAEKIRTVVPQTGEVPMVEHVVRGSNPAKVLIAASAGAELLVVGSRGRGGFASLLLGSVSQQCAVHASCPVVIVRPEASEDAHGQGGEGASP